MVLLVRRRRIIIVFLGWEGLGVTSFLLIVFYQNWARAKGGLLTLLTNRIGDAVLILRLSYLILSQPYLSITKTRRRLVLLILFILTITKRAQVPFTRWLPAAIAAPTPVSALVHRSTLVTAGIWLLIRFGQLRLLGLTLTRIFGALTLLVASLAAVLEKDTKKVVALSTLRQLGLIILAIYLGGAFICLFHLLIHALAKANLFLIVGNLIHSRFSQQDIRLISPGREMLSFNLIILIRIIRLRGMAFSSGFFSKDATLATQYSNINSLITIILLLGVVALTLVYCTIFYSMLLITGQVQILTGRARRSASCLTPSLVLSSRRILIGAFSIWNLSRFHIWKIRTSGLYWGLLLIRFLLFWLRRILNINWRLPFSLQLILILSLNSALIKIIKSVVIKITTRLTEGVYLINLLKYTNTGSLLKRIIFVSIIIVVILEIL